MAAERKDELAQRAASRFKWAFAFYVLGDFLDEVLSVDLGAFWFRPVKIGLLLGMLLSLRYARIPFRAPGTARWMLVIWGIYNLWWGISIFWNPGFGSFLNQSNIVLRHLQEFILTCGLAGALVRAGGFMPVQTVFLFFPVLAHLDLFAALGDYVAGERILRAGVVDSTSVYGIGMHGFHHERLNLAELLILGSAYLMGSKPKGILPKVARLPLITVTPFILFLLDSYSGFLGFLLFILIVAFRFMSWWGRSALLAMVFVFVGLIPKLIDIFVPLAVQKESQARLESRMEGQNTSSFRAVASEYLIREMLDNPQPFGHGYLSTEGVMSEYLGLKSTPHTIASIPYEQGLIGAGIFLVFAFCWISRAGLFVLRAPMEDMLPRPVRFCVIAMLCCATMRVFFYYQVRNIPYYCLTTALLSVAYLAYRKAWVGTTLEVPPGQPPVMG